MRNTTATGVPGRPRTPLWGRRRRKASSTWSINASSSSTSWMRRRVGSQSFSPSGRIISKMLRCACWRRTITPPRTASRLARPQALPVQFRQFPQPLLQFLPGGHARTHGLGQGLRHVITGGAVRPAETYVEVRAVLVALVATTAGASTGAIGFGEGAEEGAPGQAGEAAE